MKIVVIGPGALGCLLAAAILLRTHTREEQDGHTLWLLDRSPARAARLADHGLILEKAGKQRLCRVRATAVAGEIGPADLLFLCVKAGDVRAGLASISPLLTPESLVITLQNGISHIDILRHWPLPGRAAAGVTAQGANLAGPGHVLHAGQGPTSIGFLQPADTAANHRLTRAATLLSAAGFEATVVPDIINRVWDKLLINTGINALTAIHDCPNGQLLKITAARSQMTAAVREAAAVARARGVVLSTDPVVRTKEVCRATSANISSMLQDVRGKRATEIDAINGAVVAAAIPLGIATPINRELVHRVKELEQSYLF
ncbi:MAG: 2-dehydropantoate 2-reductase [Desulfobacterales bacterium]|nr:2-dehydropantoate 2-reductase [Desulfobacterales bacterium]